MKYKFDIFQWGRYKCSVTLNYPKEWIFSEDDIVSGILKKYPSLRNQEWTLKCS